MKKIEETSQFHIFQKIIQSMNMLYNCMRYIGHCALFHPLKNGMSLQPTLKLVSPPSPPPSYEKWDELRLGGKR